MPSASRICARHVLARASRAPSSRASVRARASRLRRRRLAPRAAPARQLSAPCRPRPVRRRRPGARARLSASVAHQLRALLLDHRRHVGEPLELALRLGEARLQASSICCSAPAERVVQRSRSMPMAAPRRRGRGARARCRTPPRALPLTPCGAPRRPPCAAASAGSRSSAAANAATAARPPPAAPWRRRVLLRRAPAHRRPRRACSRSRVPRARWRSRLVARLASMPCASRQSWRRRCSSAAPARALDGLALGVGRRRRRVRASASSAQGGQPVALGEALRGRRGASAAATNPSHRHRSPARVTSRWPGFKLRLQLVSRRAPATMPVWRRRRSARAAPQRASASGSTPAGSAGSWRGTSTWRQCTAASSAAGASRSSPSAAPSAAS